MPEQSTQKSKQNTKGVFVKIGRVDKLTGHNMHGKDKDGGQIDQYEYTDKD